MNELMNVLDSYRSSFSGRRKTFAHKEVKIGGREYDLNFWFNDPHFGRQILLSTLYDKETHKTTKMLEIDFRPEYNLIRYMEQYYSKDSLPDSSTSYILNSYDLIKEVMSWDSKEFNEFIDNLKLFLIEIV